MLFTLKISVVDVTPDTATTIYEMQDHIFRVIAHIRNTCLLPSSNMVKRGGCSAGGTRSYIHGSTVLYVRIYMKKIVVQRLDLKLNNTRKH